MGIFADCLMFRLSPFTRVSHVAYLIVASIYIFLASSFVHFLFSLSFLPSFLSSPSSFSFHFLYFLISNIISICCFYLHFPCFLFLPIYIFPRFLFNILFSFLPFHFLFLISNTMSHRKWIQLL